MGKIYVPKKGNDTPVKCDQCGDEYSADEVRSDVIRFHPTQHKGLLCELCYEDYVEEMTDSMEDSW